MGLSCTPQWAWRVLLVIPLQKLNVAPVSCQCGHECCLAIAQSEVPAATPLGIIWSAGRFFHLLPSKEPDRLYP